MATALTGIVDNTIVVRSSQVDAYGGVSSTPVVWSTSNAAVGTVQTIYGTNNAVISCLTTGTATITATMGSTTATFALTVISGVASAGNKLVVNADESFQPVNKTIQTKTS